MTARHDPPGKILGDHGTSDIKYAARVESTVMSRAITPEGARAGIHGRLRRAVCQVAHDTGGSRRFPPTDAK